MLIKYVRFLLFLRLLAFFCCCDASVWLRGISNFWSLLCLSALLYKCEAQRSSCGQCLKAPAAFECGWCTETRKCLLRQHCPSPEQNWMHHGRHNLRCSHPRITKVGNQTRGLYRPSVMIIILTEDTSKLRLCCRAETISWLAVGQTEIYIFLLFFYIL